MPIPKAVTSWRAAPSTLTLSLLAACSTEPALGPELQVATVIVSAPASRAVDEATQASIGSVSGVGVAYVSMPPGTEPNATSIRVRKVDATELITAPIVDGGLDPIGIEARPDDSLLIDLSTPEGISYAYAKVPRRSRPVVVRTAPTARRTDVVLNPFIHVVFNEPMDAATLPGAIRLLRNGEPVLGSLTSAGGESDVLAVTFIPTSTLAPGAEYELRISEDARSTSGMSLAEPVAVPFSTELVSASEPPAVPAPEPPPVTGPVSLIVTTATTGAQLDPDGYRLEIYGAAIRQLPPNGSTAFTGLAPGTYHLSIRGVSGNCTLADLMPRWPVTIPADGPLTVSIAVTCTPSFQPFGRIAFARDVGVGRRAIFVANADGSNEVQLTDGQAYDQHPAWSPDGLRVAFSSNRNGSASIHTMNADGSNLTRYPAFGADERPTWSPDGTRIAFSRFNEIYVLNLADGSISAPMGLAEAWDDDPLWLPTGMIGFKSYNMDLEDATSDIYLMNPDGTNLRPLLVGPYFSASRGGGLMWSMGVSGIAVGIGLGPSICFPACQEQYNYWVAFANGDGSNLTRIAYGTLDPPFSTEPSVALSPDGSVIAYSTSECRQSLRCIRFVLPAGGGSTVTLEDAHFPAWRP